MSPINLPEEELGFDPHANFSGCKICGAIFQSDLDRKVAKKRATPAETIQATVQRKNWTIHHAKSHTSREHDELAASGRFCTPEAAYKLAAWGVVSLPTLDDDETHAALYEAPRLPTDSHEY